MAIVGGGIIGLEMATVYSALGLRVTIIELAGQILPGAEPDMVRLLACAVYDQGVEIREATRGDEVTKLVYCPETQRFLDATIVGHSAGELLAEMVLAMEMGAIWPTSPSRCTRTLPFQNPRPLPPGGRWAP